MLCGTTMSGLVIATNYILKEFQYVHEFSVYSNSMFMKWNYLGRTRIKLKFIWLSEQLG